MNCQEALDLLYDILDKEASQINTHQVQEHLQKCKHCFERYKIEADVNTFIKEKLSHARPTVQVESLRVKILAQLDDIDREEGAVTGKKPPFWNTSFTLAAAALLVVTIASAFLVAGFYRHQDLYIPLEKAHWTAEKETAEFKNTTNTNAAMALAADTIGYQVNGSVMEYELVGGQTETIDGAPMAHFVYADADPANRDNVVSVFVVPADKYGIPSDLNKSKVDRNGTSYFDHHCRGCRLLYHRVGNAVVITATTNHDTDLFSFVPGQSSI